MSKTPNRRKHYKHYTRKTFGKSVFDDSPTLIIYEYRPPNTYKEAVQDVITAFKSNVPFNQAVDQVAALYQDSINRDKLAEHTLKYIANDN